MGAMEAERRRELERIMAGLAAGDVAMVVALATAFAGELRRTLVALASEAGLPRPSDDDLDGLVFDAASALQRVARSWRPDGGALPWVWGRGRLLQVLRADAGPAVVLTPTPLGADDADRPSPAWAGDEPAAVAVLERVAAQRGDAALVRDALDLVVSPRDRELLLLHAQQVAAGDPSPAVTVGIELDRSPDAVRQAVHRSRRKLERLALAERRFELLLRLPLLGAPAPARREAAA
jgi:hypothetical protein